MSPKKRPSKDPRLGLYQRVLLWQLAAVVILTVGFAIASYVIIRGVLLDNDEDAFLDVTQDQAARVENFYLTEQLRTSRLGDSDAINFDSITRFRDYIFELSSGSGVEILVRYSVSDAALADLADNSPDAALPSNQIWISASPLTFNETLLSPELLEQVSFGQPSISRDSFNGENRQVVGVSLAGGELLYFGVESIQATADILSYLAVIIILGSIFALILALLLVFFVLRKTFYPLRSFIRVLEQAEEGSLPLLTEPVDPDLESLKTTYNHMREIINRRLEREKQFAAEVSHELKSPLTTLTLSSAVLQDNREEFSESSREALDLLAFELDRFSRLVSDLLEISRPPESITMNLTEIDVKALLAELIDSEIPCEVEPGLAVEADAKLLGQVLTNLKQNAAEYAGGLVRAKARSEAGAVFIELEDGGPGVSDADKDKIFERFTRGESGLKRGSGSGTGLGLAIAKDRVLRHGGDLWVENVTADGGARFVIKLPGMRNS